jgi:hypothetical protein
MEPGARKWLSYHSNLAVGDGVLCSASQTQTIEQALKSGELKLLSDEKVDLDELQVKFIHIFALVDLAKSDSLQARACKVKALRNYLIDKGSNLVSIKMIALQNLDILKRQLSLADGWKGKKGERECYRFSTELGGHPTPRNEAYFETITDAQLDIDSFLVDSLQKIDTNSFTDTFGNSVHV